jgi:hypothetical protein
MPNSNDLDSSKIDSKPEEVAPAKATSEKKRRANQENGRKSRGPKTARGKSHSRWNSFQHGFFAKDLSIVKGKQLPDYADFLKLHNALREELNPQSITEELLVENFAVNCWRRARSFKCEFELTEQNFAFDYCARGLATLVRYQTAVGRELAQADDAIKQMAERSRISDEGEDNSDSMPLPDEETEIPNSERTETPLDSGAALSKQALALAERSEGNGISVVPNLTERTQ